MAEEELNHYKTFVEFFESINHRVIHYKHKGRAWLKVDFFELAMFNTELSEVLLEKPEEMLEIAQKALKSVEPYDMVIRFFNMPLSQERSPWEIRGEDVDKFISLKGILNKISPIIHICTRVKFECPSCGKVIDIAQEGEEIKEPHMCACGRKGKFKVLDQEFMDAIKLGIIDDLMEDKNKSLGIAKEKIVLLFRDLTHHLIDRELKVGKKVRINGYFKYTQKKTRSGAGSLEFVSIFIANSIEFIKVGWDIVKIEEGDKEEIINLSKDKKILDRLANCIADIEGHDIIKKACILLLTGAPHIYDSNFHLNSRGTIHMLMIGDPGCQPAGSKVWMANGEWKNIEEIKEGDEVLSPDKKGNYKYAKVMKTYKWFSDKNYDVVQLNKEHKPLYSCSYNHIIPVHHRVMPRVKGYRDPTLRHWDYKEFRADEFEKIGKENKTRKNVGFSCFAIPSFKGRDNCKIEPYSLGAYLGDGHFTINKYSQGISRSFGITSADPEIMEEISKHYPIMWISKIREGNKSLTYRFSLIGEFAKLLTSYGLENKRSKEKFIPTEALLSNLEYRKKLLAGLIDTDGTHSKSAYTISTVSEQLSKDILNLVYSLGGRANIKERYVKYQNQKRRYFNISLYLCGLDLPIKTKRKQKITNEVYVSSDRIAIDVKPKQGDWVYGFEIDSESKWYITDNFMVTHNTGKTFLAKRAGTISPINYFQSAANASGKGLVASVNQDKELGIWVAYPGVVPMANQGVVIIDEIDKTSEEDYGDHNNAMNDMEVFIAKSNVKAKLITETSYLATANPANRVFTDHELFYNQIDMPKDFMDRFDLIFPMVSPTDSEKKDKIMDSILDRYIDNKDVEKKWKPEFSHEFITKYISYCRREKPLPTLSKDFLPYIKKRLHGLMKPKGEDQIKVSFRQLESILRFAYASARLHLRDVAQADIDFAFELKYASFLGLHIINESGDFDWAKLENIEVQKISDKNKVIDIIKDMLADSEQIVDVQEIMAKCRAAGITDETLVDEIIEKKKQAGDYYEPRRGFLRRI